MLAEYSRAVRELKCAGNDPGSPGKLLAGRPFFLKAAIHTYLGNQDILSDPDEVVTREYDKISAELDTLVAAPGTPFRELLRQDLGAYVAEYETELCATAAGMELSRKNDFTVREKIQLLAEALADDPLCAGLFQKIAYLDSQARNGSPGMPAAESKKVESQYP